MYPFWIRWYLKIFPYFSLTRFVRDAQEPFYREESGGLRASPSTVNILARCGLGDLLSFMARLGAVKRRHPGTRIRFLLGGHRRIPLLMRDVLFRDPRVEEVVLINGWQTTSERRKAWVRRDMERLTRAPGSLLLDWIDLLPALDYRMDFPYRIRLTPREESFARDFYAERGLDPRRTLLLQCLSLSGNASGFETARFWPKESYRRLMRLFLVDGWKIVLLGWGDENYGFEEDPRMGVFRALARRPDGFQRPLDPGEAAALLVTAGGFVGTNSWTWEVAYRAGTPTLTFYLVNRDWIPVHAPDEVMRKARNLRVVTDPALTPREVFGFFRRLKRGH